MCYLLILFWILISFYKFCVTQSYLLAVFWLSSLTSSQLSFRTLVWITGKVHARFRVIFPFYSRLRVIIKRSGRLQHKLTNYNSFVEQKKVFMNVCTWEVSTNTKEFGMWVVSALSRVTGSLTNGNTYPSVTLSSVKRIPYRYTIRANKGRTVGRRTWPCGQHVSSPPAPTVCTMQ